MKRTVEHVFVTGGTGFVGRHFIYWLLNLDKNVRVTVLTRGESAVAASQRFMDLVARVANDYGLPFDRTALRKRCTVELSDITKPSCGISPQQMEKLRGRGRSTFWHLAASLNFEESQRERIESHNVLGTNEAIELARGLNCERFVYVSTAYVCGRRNGEVAERLHSVEGPFGNAYERSKCTAEHNVVQRCAHARMDYCIVRPSIVVGISSSGMPAGSDTGLYGFARELLRMRRVVARHVGPIRIEGDSQAEINLVPVDFVAQRMVQLNQNYFAEGPIVHLAGNGGPTAQELTDSVSDALGIPRFQFVHELPSNASPLERILAKRIEFYSSYLKDSKRFLSRLGTAPPATAADTYRYVACYLRERANDRYAMVERAMTARDGFPLHTARNERAPNSLRESVVIVNALGMPHAALEKLTAKLSVYYDVLTWESRGVPSVEGVLDHRSAGFDRHVDDLEDVMANYGVTRAHVIGWCTGADVGLAFATRHPERVLSLSCLNGGFVRAHRGWNQYQRNVEKMVRRVSRSRAYAQLYFDLMTRTRLEVGTESTACSTLEKSVEDTLACLNQELLYLTGAPLQSPETLQRYCLLLDHYFDEAPNCVPQLAIPALFCTATDDEIASCGATQHVASGFRDAQVYFSPSDGHFAPCTSDALVHRLEGFLLSRTACIRAIDTGNRLDIRSAA